MSGKEHFNGPQTEEKPNILLKQFLILSSADQVDAVVNMITEKQLGLVADLPDSILHLKAEDIENIPNWITAKTTGIVLSDNEINLRYNLKNSLPNWDGYYLSTKYLENSDQMI